MIYKRKNDVWCAWFTTGVNFHLKSYVNKQGNENWCVCLVKSLPSTKVIVWNEL